MIFFNNIKSFSGLWREHVQLIKGLREVVHLFYMPEVHQYLVPMLMEFIFKGNKEIKEVSCDCIAKILKYQHHTPSRDDLLQCIMSQMSQSPNWIQRKAYIYFCKYAIQYLPKEFFRKYFIKDYI